MDEPPKRHEITLRAWQKALEKERRDVEEEAKRRKPGEPQVISQVEMMDWEAYEEQKRREDKQAGQ